MSEPDKFKHHQFDQFTEQISYPARCSDAVNMLIAHHNEFVELRSWVLNNGKPLAKSLLEIYLKKRFGSMRRFYLDREYRISDLQTVEWAIRHSGAKSFRYVKNTFDCDDFANVFKGEMATLGINSVALVVDQEGRHAYNLIATGEKLGEVNFLIVEPQTGKVIKELAIGKKPYNMDTGWIVF